jgi:hypothetical protein
MSFEHVQKILAIQGDFKIELISNGIPQQKAHDLSASIMQKILDSGLLKSDVQGQVQKMIEELPSASTVMNSEIELYKIKDYSVKDEKIKTIRNLLVNRCFYWVKWQPHEDWEIAKWDMGNDKFKFTNGLFTRLKGIAVIDTKIAVRSSK